MSLPVQGETMLSTIMVYWIVLTWQTYPAGFHRGQKPGIPPSQYHQLEALEATRSKPRELNFPFQQCASHSDLVTDLSLFIPSLPHRSPLTHRHWLPKSVVSRILFIEAGSHSRHIVPRHLGTSGWKTAEKPHKMQEIFSTIIFTRLEGL